MPGKHTELPFEDAIFDYLGAHGWRQGASANYDRELALYPEDVEGWLRETQPKEWAKVEQRNAGEAARHILELLAKQIEKQGALAVLRHGFKDINATFSMCQFAASHTLTPVIQAQYERVRLRVVRQLHYSLSNDNAIDLVLFINGIPVATLELKSDFTQSVEDAIAQYRHDRLPRDPSTRRDEPLLIRALVHFAVSMQAVAMTTALRGKETRFLPFNRGNDGRAGNPPNPDGYPTSYLWEEILEPATFLDIVGRFLHVTKPNGAAGAKTVIFPRYHQWDCVTQLIATARTEGAGNRYLIQHSAGSGKSNSIAWLAHRLSDLYGADNQKVFDAVIVITDRNVLDAQLKETIFQFEHTSGVIANITNEHSAKSAQLAEALAGKKLIIIVTIQTFPFVIEHLTTDTNLRDLRYAVIADEAHSSQAGSVARKMRQVLSNVADDDADNLPGDEIDAEDVLETTISQGRFPTNMSYFAFTATPKGKTIELFGRVPDPTRPPSNTNLPAPFHVYTMQQAIEEGFILDVLKNYTPYRIAFKLAHDGQEYDEDTVDEHKALKSLMRWVRLHPYNIAQKVQIIVEHFRQNVLWRLGGRAKAMVVTGSRKEAVRYTLAMRHYIAEQRYGDIGVLVAFSGDVEDETSGPTPFNEHNLNPDIGGRDLREAFNEVAYNIMLVANKFQTGFDQPLLTAMYVDKQLSGITAVQTLSRLNRTMPGKEITYVLDFVNDPVEILMAFQQYYRDAHLGYVSDPNIIHDLQAKLDGAVLYTSEEVERFAAAYINPNRRQSDLVAIISPIAQRIHAREAAAITTGNQIEREIIVLFRKDMQSFVRAYEFLAQIVDYGGTELEKRSIFYRCLLPYLSQHHDDSAIDLSKVVMTHYHAQPQLTRDLPLGSEEGIYVKGLSAIGSAMVKEPEKVFLSEVIRTLNEVFEGQLSEADIVNYANHIRDKMLESPTVRQQAQANAQDRLVLSPDFERELQQTIINAMTNHTSMSEQLLSNTDKMQHFRTLIAEMLYRSLSQG